MGKIKDHRQWVQSVLRPETADWTPQCPDPETLLDWLEQGDKHPEADQLLVHLFSCAHCRQQRVALREIRVLSAERQLEAAGRIDPGILRELPAKVGKWVRELIAEGMTPPVPSMRAALDRLPGMSQLRTPALARGQEAPVIIRPVGTALRSGRPTLCWSAGPLAREYEIAILQPNGRNGFPRSAWQSSAESAQQLAGGRAYGPRKGPLHPGRLCGAQGVDTARDRGAGTRDRTLAPRADRSLRGLWTL